MNATMQTLAAFLAACACAAPALAANPAAASTKRIVIVPGEFIDGSSWHVVHDILSQKGYHVTVVAARTRRSRPTGRPTAPTSSPRPEDVAQVIERAARDTL